MPVVALPAVSTVRTLKLAVPLLSVTPLALHVEPLTVAVTHVVPPFAETWIVSPAPSVPLKVPLTVWLGSLGQGCMGDWARLGREAFSLRSDWPCLMAIVFIGAVPAAAIATMLGLVTMVMSLPVPSFCDDVSVLYGSLCLSGRRSTAPNRSVKLNSYDRVSR